eukprot:403373700
MVSAMEPWELRGQAYESQLAKDKFVTIWNEVIKDTSTKVRLFSFANEFLQEDMHPSLNWVGDTVPFDDILGKREKIVHTEGVVGAVKFVPAKDLKTSYSGVLSSGADYGFIRFSAGPPFDPSFSAGLGNFAPSFGLKLMRDGVTSANLVAATVNQDNWNFFQRDFSNLIAVQQEPVFSKFKEATEFTHRVGLKDFSQYDQTGAFVKSPVFPYQLIFSPSDDVKNFFPDEYTIPFIYQLSTLAKGTVLFDVYTVAEPNDDKVLIGTLELLEDATTSLYGDETLFFQHADTVFDIQSKPAWKKFLLPNSVDDTVQQNTATPSQQTKVQDLKSIKQQQPSPSPIAKCPFISSKGRGGKNGNNRFLPLSPLIGKK